MSTEPQKFYVLETKTQGASASIGINGVPLLTDRDGAGLETGRAFNQWIKRGENTMHVFVNWPADKNFEPGTATTEARLFIAAPGGGAPQPGEVLGELEWPVDGEEEKYPRRLETTFEVEEPPPVKLWGEAESVAEVTPADHRMMVDTVNRISENLKNGDARGAYELLDYKFREEERAEGRSPGAFRDVVIEQFEVVSKEEGLGYEPITVDASTVRLFADGQVALLERMPPSDAFVMQAGPGRFRFATYFGRIDGTWTIVR